MLTFVTASLAASLAVVTAQDSVPVCETPVLTALLTDPFIDQCASDSGYVFTAASVPDQATIDLMCASEACNNLLADVTAMDLTECTLPVGDNINLLSDLVDYVPANCPSASGSAGTSTTEATSTAGSSTGSDTVVAPSSSAAEGSTAGSSTEEPASSSDASSETAADSAMADMSMPMSASDSESASESASESGSSGAASLSACVLGAASVVAAIATAYVL